jgi:hypothetical protein
MNGGKDSSPFDSSPYNGRSPHAFWQGRASPSRFSTENMFERDQSPTVAKRPSVEKLKQASRVKNSSMFAREQKNEYDPSSVPVVERPLAANRPLTQYQGNAFNGRGVEGGRQENTSNNPAIFKSHRRGESQTKIPLLSPTKPTEDKSPSPSPRNQASPTKSSLSSKQNHNTFPRRFDPESAQWSDDETEAKISPPRALRRHAKSVTFDTGPQEIFEYEMVTPDPSSVASGSREGSYDTYDSEDDAISLDLNAQNNDDSFDASLEDTDKTPVVLPEDWRHMSPDAADAELAATFDDPFNANNDGRSTPSQQWNTYRTASVNSDSDPRPLPPVPPFAQSLSRPTSSNSPSSVAERVQAAHAQRTLPTPPRAATTSKSEILGMKNDAMSLEDRLRLMGLQDNSTQDSGSKEAARLRKHGLGIHVYEDEVEDEDSVTTTTQVTTTEVVEDYKFPRISRESILRKVKSRTFDYHEDEYDMDRLSEERDYANLDPDVAIPSRECSSNFDETVPDVIIKQEEEEEVDVYDIPEMYNDDRDDGEFDREGSVVRHDVSGPQYDDHENDESFYSQEVDEKAPANHQVASNSASDDDGPPTPRQNDLAVTDTLRISTGSEEGHMSLPDLSHIDDDDFQSGLGAYLTSSSTPPPPPEKDSPKPEMASSATKFDMSSMSDFFRRPGTPEQDGPEFEEQEEPGTPDSVLHHPIEPYAEEERGESPAIPAPVATIKAPDGTLKTRPSATPADMASLAAARRQVSGQMPPPIPDKSPKRLSMSLEPEARYEQYEQEELNPAASVSPAKRRQSFKRLDITENSFGEDLSLGLDEEFDRVIEGSKVDLYSLSTPAQDLKQNRCNSTDCSFFANLTPRSKKGYLMRQNTKVVIAKRNFSNESGSTIQERPSSAGARSSNSSPRKPSHERSKSWTTEPWNGKARRKSIRSSSGNTKPSMSGPMPPLPGQESAVTGLDTVIEDQMMSHGEELGLEDGIERGRLFVKVVGVKELDLPLPQSESPPVYID